MTDFSEAGGVSPNSGEEPQGWGILIRTCWFWKQKPEVGVDMYVPGAELHSPGVSAELTGGARRTHTERREKGGWASGGKDQAGGCEACQGPAWRRGSFEVTGLFS